MTANKRSKKKRFIKLLISGASLILLAVFGVTSPKTDSTKPTSGYKVVKVIDGDTINVKIDSKQETIRLIGVDTPELYDPRKPVQCFASEASSRAKSLMSNQVVSLEADSTQGERDKYGRLLRFVYLPDGRMVNKILIEDGFAHEYTYQGQPYKYQDDFRSAQANARDQEKGFWAAQTCGGDTRQPVK